MSGISERRVPEEHQLEYWRCRAELEMGYTHGFVETPFGFA
jgi:hypothetical protein